MYNYKFNYDEEIQGIHKKALKKVIVTPALTLIGLFDVVIIIGFWWLFYEEYKMNLTQYALLTVSILVIQAIVVAIISKKIINASLKDLKKCKVEATFDEDGFKYHNEDTFKTTKWSGIKSIRVFDDFIIVQDSVNGFTTNIMALKNFDGTKEEVIAAIEKYIKIRRR